MKLLKKWHKPDNSHEKSIARTHATGTGLAPMAHLRDQMDEMFNRLWRDFSGEPLSPTTWAEPLDAWSSWPAMDLTEDDRTVKLQVDVPGVDEKDITVEVSGNVLTIRGVRQDERTESREGVHHIERVSGSFSRSVTLPPYADPQKVDARYDKGTLTITAPKVPGHGPKRVPIKTA